MPNFGIVAARELREVKTKRSLDESTFVFTYHGGRLIRNVSISVFYWGDRWRTEVLLQNTRAYIDKFFGFYLSGPSISQLSEYSVANFQIGLGNFQAPSTIITPGPDSNITDDDVRNRITSELTATGTTPTENSVFLVFLPPGVQVTSSEGKSCVNFCGYHSDIDQKIIYGVIPYPCNRCAFTGSDIANLTCITSHEICEIITDPIAKTGWWDPSQDEIGDICVNKLKQESYYDQNGIELTYTVQKKWSNTAGECI